MSIYLNQQLSRLVPYTPGEQPQDRQFIKLNTNESPYPPPPAVMQAFTQTEMENLRLYSDPQARRLKQQLAKQYGVESENVFVTNGSDEALCIAFMAYAKDGRGVAFPDISYGFYSVFSDLYGIEVQKVPLKEDFSIDPQQYFNLHKTIVIANPNAPTGLALSLDEVQNIVANNADSVVMIDEAYVDFGAESAVQLTKKYPNLLVVQTFSKSRSMAGARLGYAIGNAALIQDLETIRFSINPYNVNRVTLKAGELALQNQPYFDENCKRIIRTRQVVQTRLRELGFVLTDSKTNFVFAKPPKGDAKQLYLALKENGILVRHFDQPRVCDYLRITIGSEQEMECFLKTVEGLL